MGRLLRVLLIVLTAGAVVAAYVVNYRTLDGGFIRFYFILLAALLVALALAIAVGLLVRRVTRGPPGAALPRIDDVAATTRMPGDEATHGYLWLFIAVMCAGAVMTAGAVAWWSPPIWVTAMLVAGGVWFAAMIRRLIRVWRRPSDAVPQGTPSELQAPSRLTCVIQRQLGSHRPFETWGVLGTLDRYRAIAGKDGTFDAVDRRSLDGWTVEDRARILAEHDVLWLRFEVDALAIPSRHAQIVTRFYRALAKAGHSIAALEAEHPSLWRRYVFAVTVGPVEVPMEVDAAAGMYRAAEWLNRTLTAARPLPPAVFHEAQRFVEDLPIVGWVVTRHDENSDACDALLRSIHRGKLLREQLSSIPDRSAAALLRTLFRPTRKLLAQALRATEDVDVVIASLNAVETFVRHQALSLLMLLDRAQIAAPESRQLEELTMGKVTELMARLIKRPEAPAPIREAWAASCAPRDEIRLAAVRPAAFPATEVTCLQIARGVTEVRNQVAHRTLSAATAAPLAAPLLDAFLRMAISIEAAYHVETRADDGHTTISIEDRVLLSESGAPLVTTFEGRLFLLGSLEPDRTVYVSYEGTRELQPTTMEVVRVGSRGRPAPPE